MKWITRERPKIDRIACPWLLLRFVDPEAEIIYVPFDQVLPLSQSLPAIPFDIPGVEYTHYGKDCTFDYIIRKHGITDQAVLDMAPIVRGADTDKHELARQAAGLWAIAAGMAYNYPDDQVLLQQGMIIYDALYSWAKYLQQERHLQHPQEDLLIQVFDKFLKAHTTKKIPAWARELKEMIQDHIDSNLNLTELSRNLDINPSYLSREFSKHFDNLSFGEYIRRQRIEKAIDLMKDPAHSLTHIAYLTGFSDQSHFTRIFKKHTGQSPSAYRKKNSPKGKE
ncbi:chromate resistance protein ChrB domain-containing protein [Paraflavitalea pollutisoli]|uniref:chromate resistance protein ChrB domain-containing protein n=1 Tax=Paraflavitalea pollutisoli TaxID=3034143 RepID=UPI0023EB6B39|nr:chromate resistance protein ChrB domain-containing protein [Paraflavitalea sp. H1-2-19X]